jgi:hypothetical protein
MSWNDQDIDHLFKGAKAPEPPAFQEEFWKEMEAMLPVAEAAPKRRVAGFWWISGIAATVLLITGAYWMGRNDGAAQLAAGTTTKTEDISASQQPEATDTKNTAPTNTAHTQDRLNSTGTDHATANAEQERIPEIHPSENVQSPQPLVREPVNPVQPEAVVHVAEEPVTPMTPLTLAFGQHAVYRTQPDALPYKGERFYMQTSAGIGQSAQRNVGSSSDLLHYYTLGAGLYKRIDRMVLTYGVNGRIDLSRNVISSKMNTGDHRIDTRYSELYSLEMPVSLGFNFGRNTFAASLTPGYQVCFTGKETEFENAVLVRSERTSGKVENAKTLTMEFGLSYWRTLQPNLYLGAAINADAIRPFNPNNFIGDQRMLPVNGQIILRKTF